MTVSSFLDFMSEEDGFKSPLMPSVKYPQGKSYHVPSPDAETGLRLNALADVAMKMSKGFEVKEFDIQRLRMDDTEEREFADQVLSAAVVQQMIEDGCRWEHVKRLTQYAFTYFGVSPEAAENAAKAGLFSGKAPAPNRAARRTGAKSRKSPASGASRKTTPRS